MNKYLYSLYEPENVLNNTIWVCEMYIRFVKSVIDYQDRICQTRLPICFTPQSQKS